MKTQVDASKVLAALGKLPRAVRFQFGDALDHISLKFLKKFRTERLSGGSEGVKARSGGLYRRFKRVFLVPSNSQGMGVEIFTESKIAKLHEEGGVMRSEIGRRLTVPISRRSEETESSTGAVKKKYGGTSYIRDIKALQKRLKLRVITVGGKTFLFAPKREGEGQTAPLFVLQQNVRITPRLGFYKTWKDLEPEAIKIVNDALFKAAKEAVS